MNSPKRKRNQYVNNKKFLNALIEHRKKIVDNLKNGKEEPILSDYIGECFIFIATRYAQKPNFSGYAFKNEMIADAIENCVRYYYNFDPEKSNNPFAYFTRIVHNAFLRRIEREKEELYLKYKHLENYMITHIDSKDINNALLNDGTAIDLSTDYMNNFISDFENRVEQKKINSRERLKIKKEKINDTSSD